MGISSTYLYFGEICDILGYHRFSKGWFFTDYLNVSVFFTLSSDHNMLMFALYYFQ